MDFFRMKNSQNVSSIGTNPLRGTLLFFQYVSCLYIAAAKNFDKITVIKAITVKVNTDEVDRISIALSTANDYRAWATRL